MGRMKDKLQEMAEEGVCPRCDEMEWRMSELVAEVARLSALLAEAGILIQ